MIKELKKFVPIRTAADEFGVTRQRMRQLIEFYGVPMHKMTPRFVVIEREDLRKIPKNRHIGRPRKKT